MGKRLKQDEALIMQKVDEARSFQAQIDKTQNRGLCMRKVIWLDYGRLLVKYGICKKSKRRIRKHPFGKPLEDLSPNPAIWTTEWVWVDAWE